MTAVRDVTIKVKADTTDAVRKIRALRDEAQTPPVEVLLVAERLPFWRGLVMAWLALALNSLAAGFTLMLFLPLAGETLAVALPAPGYWRCVGLAALLRMTYTSAFGRIRPVASQRRSS